ncbi:hypothetical protein ACH5RR_023977 [Cinchona calisaya]|uniref:RNase H type-1 domain-containing protein n=1 Tax=Cinchona calisaya TaxID=153742 RepID=A0ABD2ZFI6_9GENT
MEPQFGNWLKASSNKMPGGSSRSPTKKPSPKAVLQIQAQSTAGQSSSAGLAQNNITNNQNLVTLSNHDSGGEDSLLHSNLGTLMTANTTLNSSQGLVETVQSAQYGTQVGSSTKTPSLNQTFDKRILNQEKYNICTVISENAMINKLGVGMICKDDEGKLRRVWAFYQDRSLSKNAIEAKAIKSAMIKARDAAWSIFSPPIKQLWTNWLQGIVRMLN